jgi:hypothetical protein
MAYLALLASTEGPLVFYGSPNLYDHASTREAWGIPTACAELGWDGGESHAYLFVRHQEPDTARTIKAMVIERFPDRSALVRSLGEVRTRAGVSLSFPFDDAAAAVFATDPTHLSFEHYPWPLPASLTRFAGAITLRGYPFPLPDGLEFAGAHVDATGYKFPLPASLKRVDGLIAVSGRELSLKEYREERKSR